MVVLEVMAMEMVASAAMVMVLAMVVVWGQDWGTGPCRNSKRQREVYTADRSALHMLSVAYSQ